MKDNGLTLEECHCKLVEVVDHLSEATVTDIVIAALDMVVEQLRARRVRHWCERDKRNSKKVKI